MSKKKRKPTPEDRERGRLWARRRKVLGLTQKDMGERLGMTHQQYGKYERGEDRIRLDIYKAILEVLGLADPAIGFQEAPQESFEIPITKAALQNSLEQVRAALSLWQRHLDQAM